MKEIYYKDKYLFIEEIKISEIIKEIKTPAYIYSKQNIIRKFNEFKNAFQEIEPLIYYSVKANSNLSIITILSEIGASFSVGSLGELYKVLSANVSPDKICFGGLGKTETSIDYAISNGVNNFVIETFDELKIIDEISGRYKKIVKIFLRINPDIDAETHPYITTGKLENKFGIDINLINNSNINFANLNIMGIHSHLGSQISNINVFKKSIEKLNILTNDLKKKGIDVKYLNLGGGFPVIYEEKVPNILEIAKVIKENKIANYKIALEPGRFLVADSGLLILKILYKKTNGNKNFLILDSGMNILLRPALYKSYHKIYPIEIKSNQEEIYNVVGPICESSDYLGIGRKLPICNQGDFMAVFTVGAYGSTMSSNYNCYCKPIEILVNKNNYSIIRKRETLEDLILKEKI